MDRFDRIYRLHSILSNSRYPVSRKNIQGKLECSRATFTRIVEDLRDFLGAPIEYDRKYNGYYYAKTDDHQYELPGLWFNATEIHALLACQELLKNVEPGLLDGHIKPLRNRIDEILALERTYDGEVEKRIKILRMAYRTPPDRPYPRRAFCREESETILRQNARRLLRPVLRHLRRKTEIHRSSTFLGERIAMGGFRALASGAGGYLERWTA